VILVKCGFEVVMRTAAQTTMRTEIALFHARLHPFIIFYTITHGLHSYLAMRVLTVIYLGHEEFETTAGHYIHFL